MKVFIIGVGAGSTDTLTVGAKRIIEGSGLLIGAKRLLEPFADLSCEKLALVKPADIAEALTHASCDQASVLMSGDTGFFSGATKLYDLLGDFDVEVVPGISSVQVLAARARIPWEDAHFASAHGRACDIAALVRSHAKVMLLTGGDEKAHDLCRELVDAGLGDVRVIIGERLSYPDERIVDGRAEELAGQQFENLAVMLVMNDGTEDGLGGGFPEGNLPTAARLMNEDKLQLRKRPIPFRESSAKASAPRLLIGAPASGGGKTTFTCGLLQALVNRGLAPAACKCGPDYIDPMFHEQVIGAYSRNLDLFFCSDEQVCRLVADSGEHSDVVVIEGAMGYYDGIAVGDRASAWDVARATHTPAVLVVDGRGRARSIAAEIAGFAQFKPDSHVAGVVFNRVSAALYPRLKEVVEDATGVRVYGHLPELTDCSLESRHLGLVTAREVENLRAKLNALAAAIAETVDVEGLLALAATAPDLGNADWQDVPAAAADEPVRIAVARDDAFCFYYADTLRMLEHLGAELVEFSPLHDARLPEGVAGLYIGGGYPELRARELAENTTMLASVRDAIAAGMPTIAECGGFMYLHEQMEGDDGVRYPMVGAVAGASFKTERLGRFGYIEMTARGDGLLCGVGEKLRAHEFHYWDSENPGDAFHAEKPESARSWECGMHTPTLYAGYPHLCLHGNAVAAQRFITACKNNQLAQS